MGSRAHCAISLPCMQQILPSGMSTLATFRDPLRPHCWNVGLVRPYDPLKDCFPHVTSACITNHKALCFHFSWPDKLGVSGAIHGPS